MLQAEQAVPEHEAVRQVTPVGEMAQEAKRGGCPGVLARRWKQVLIVLVLVGVITWVVVDQVTKSCMLVEQEGDRVQRLFCEGAIQAGDDGAVTPGQPFICAPDGMAVSDEGWMMSSGVTPPRCEAQSACLSKGFDSLQRWIAGNVGLGWIAISSLYAVLTVLLIPGSVLTIGSGIAFGTALGLGLGTLVAASAVIVGASIGAMLAFLLGRFLLREHIEGWASKYQVLQAIDGAFADKGLFLVLLLRFSPVVPFNVFNFVMGSTSCRFRDYAIGTMFGIIPGTCAFVLIGALVGSAAFETGGGLDGGTVRPDDCEADPSEQTIRTVVLVVGIVATILAVVLLTHYARKQFKKIQDEAERKTESAGRVSADLEHEN